MRVRWLLTTRILDQTFVWVKAPSRSFVLLTVSVRVRAWQRRGWSDPAHDRAGRRSDLPRELRRVAVPAGRGDGRHRVVDGACRPPRGAPRRAQGPSVPRPVGAAGRLRGPRRGPRHCGPAGAAGGDGRARRERGRRRRARPPRTAAHLWHAGSRSSDARGVGGLRRVHGAQRSGRGFRRGRRAFLDRRRSRDRRRRQSGRHDTRVRPRAK